MKSFSDITNKHMQEDIRRTEKDEGSCIGTGSLLLFSLNIIFAFLF